jgi:acetate kinase
MHILTVNTGSTSVKLDVFDTDVSIEQAQLAIHKHGQDIAPDAVFKRVFEKYQRTDIDLIVHRIVHGGPELTEPSFITDRVKRTLEATIPMAPLHNPTALRWLGVCEQHFNDTPQVAVFDTAFFANLPARSGFYAIPQDRTETRDIRRFGFHGLAHQAMWQAWCQQHPLREDGGRVITLQLGGGCSVTAIANGQVQDTSMGFSPLEGLMMATRSGDIDAGALIYLLREKGMTLDDLETLLNESSGLYGVSQYSPDMNDLLQRDDAKSRLAVEMYCYRIRKYLGAFMAALGGIDGIVFGGGVGENSPQIRQRVIEDMAWLNLRIDTQRNRQQEDAARAVSPGDADVGIWVVPVDEARILVQHGLDLMGRKRHHSHPRRADR